MKNKKGFTLVELLAVIVILALIMSIAIVSIGGILNSARKSTLKETAVSIINGVRQQIIVANKLEVGDYVFSTALLEKGGTDSPLGGTYDIASSINGTGGYDCTGKTKIGDVICKISDTTTTSCAKGQKSFVRVSQNGTTYSYSICLTNTGNYKYIKLGSETDLLDNNNETMIKDYNE